MVKTFNSNIYIPKIGHKGKKYLIPNWQFFFSLNVTNATENLLTPSCFLLKHVGREVQVQVASISVWVESSFPIALNRQGFNTLLRDEMKVHKNT